MSSDPELSRIVDAYRSYDQDPHEQAKRAAANPGNRAIEAERGRALDRILLETMSGRPLAGAEILDVGCGRGDMLAWLEARGAAPARLHGVDLLEDRITAGRAAHPELDLRTANAEHLDWPDGHFDLVVCMTVFSSILDAGLARSVAAEMARVTRPGGRILWYDVRLENRANPNTRAIPAALVSGLFPGFRPRLRAVTLIPPLARRLGPLTGLLYPVLAAVPILRSHLIGTLEKLHAD